MRGPFDPIDIGTEHISAATRIELRVVPMGGYVEARVCVDAVYVATGVGRTLGEALMTAGALMTDTPIMPMHRRILRRLGIR